MKATLPSGLWSSMGHLRLQAWRFRDAVQDHLRGRTHRERVFTRIYEQNLWGDPESLSGQGSGTVATDAVRSQLPMMFRQYGIRTLLDAPCGDFHWMQHVAGVLDQYVGVDIVPDLIAHNQARYGSERIRFTCADITVDALPGADAVLCRDCFIHLPTRLILRALANFRASRIRYVLLTSDRDVQSYHDIPVGSFRTVNFLKPPFEFPDPVWVLNEGPSGSRQLCMWALESVVG